MSLEHTETRREETEVGLKERDKPGHEGIATPRQKINTAISAEGRDLSQGKERRGREVKGVDKPSQSKDTSTAGVGKVSGEGDPAHSGILVRARDVGMVLCMGL